MPVIHDVTEPHGPKIVVRPSVAVELQWALGAAYRIDYHPVLAAAYAQSPGLAERVRSFWDDEVAITCDSFLELVVLAHQGDALFSSDGGLLLRRLKESCTMVPPELRLASETESDRFAILNRLDQLRESEERRREYTDLLRELWMSLDGAWERDGRRAVDAAIAGRRELIAKGAPWRDIVRGDCDFDGMLPRLVDGLSPTDELAIVPAFFNHRGLLFDLPGVLVVGVPTDQSGVESRLRTELLARRLKSISDPTRLAILDSLSRHPCSVSEIATSFGLAQPTVSNHVKVLRDAGLVANDAGANGSGRGIGTGIGGHKGSRDLVVQPDAVADLLDHLRSVLRPLSEEEPGEDG